MTNSDWVRFFCQDKIYLYQLVFIIRQNGIEILTNQVLTDIITQAVLVMTVIELLPFGSWTFSIVDFYETLKSNHHYLGNEMNNDIAYYSVMYEQIKCA